MTWTGNNRTHMVRVPGKGRFELRLPDGSANPYLLQAVIIAAGLDGLHTKADPGKRHDIDMYQLGHTVTDAPKLPLNLLDALRAFDRDDSLKEALGIEFSAALPEAQASGMARLRVSLHPVGTGQHARRVRPRWIRAALLLLQALSVGSPRIPANCHGRRPAGRV